MKISSLVKPSAVALALTFCGTPYALAQDKGDDSKPANQQSDAQNQSQNDQSKKDSSKNDKSNNDKAAKEKDHATCPVCGLSVENTKDDTKGVKVVDVKSGSPADKAGIQKDDLLVTINDKDVKSAEQMHKLMAKQQKKSEASKVKVGTRRGDNDREVTLTLKSKDDQKSQDDKEKKNKNKNKNKDKQADKKNQNDDNKQASLGVTLDPSSPRLGKGVRISSVYTNGPAQQAGLKTGDRILKVDGHDVSSIQEVQDRIEQMDPDHKAEITVLVDGEEEELNIMLASKAETIQRAMVGNQPPSARPGIGVNANQSLNQTLTEIRNELRDLRRRVDAMENGDNDSDDDNAVERRNDSDNDDQ